MEKGKLISAEEIRAFTDDLLKGYIELMSGETPVLHKMKEIWTWLIVGFPDKDKYLKRIVKSKSVAEYRIAADEALKGLEEADKPCAIHSPSGYFMDGWRRMIS